MRSTLEMTSLKGVSSMKLHHDLDITPKTAWFMQQRIREASALAWFHRWGWWWVGV